jgi:hypothetical protein
MNLLPGFGGSPPKPSIPAAPAPLPTRDDPAVLEAKERTRQADLRRKGRQATLITGGRGVTTDAVIERPEALGGTSRGAQLLGQAA